MEQQGSSYQVYLFDYAVDTSYQLGGVFVYGYVNRDSRYKKIILKLTDVQIFFDVAIDEAIFSPVSGEHDIGDISEETATRMMKEIYDLRHYHERRDQSVQHLIQSHEFIKRKHFKGMRRDQTFSHIRLSFKNFKDYEELKRILSHYNDQYIQHAKHYSTKKKTAIEKMLPVNKEVPVEDINTHSVKSLLQGCNYFAKRAPFRMSEDDPASRYVFKIQRHHGLHLCDWNTITLYEPLDAADLQRALMRKRSGLITTKGGRLYAEVSVKDIKQEDVMGSSNRIPLQVMTWDIEVSTQSGKFDDNAHNPENRIICIGYTVGDPCSLGKPEKSVCIVTQGCNASQIKGEDQDMIEIVQKDSELEMILEFARHIRRTDPAFITGFNDSSFDWCFLVKKLEMYGGVQQQEKKGVAYDQKWVEAFSYIINCMNEQEPYERGSRSNLYPCSNAGGKIFEQSEVKINAGNNRKGIMLKVPGIICVDTRTLLMKDQALEKRSLNDYLLANNLPLKIEVSFDVMNIAFRAIISKQGTEQHYKDLLHIYEYCSYDADACRLLWAKRNILRQIIEISKMSYTPIRSGFVNANGVKVRNMVAAFANSLGYSVPMASTSSDVRVRDSDLLDIFEKYPGAYVPEPHKGVSLSPVIALDFASLYPSIIMAHNLSPECVIEEDDVIQQIKAEPTDAGEVLVSTSLQSQPLMCSKIEVEFEQAKKELSYTLVSYVRARSENVGIYPQILANLFKMRKEVKAQLATIERNIEANEQDIEQVKELRFQYSLVDARQRAIKVFMNTFYGETGNQLSSLFDVVISGGTTSFGQRYIKHVHRVIALKDCEVVAGDTDSIYFRPRASHYSKSLLEKFDPNQMLSEGMGIAFRLQREVNEMMAKKTHGVLKMEFEEMLCPSIFTGKKKYFGVVYKPNESESIDIIKHVDVRKDALVKGVDFIKSQYPQLIKETGYGLLQDLLNTFNAALISVTKSEEEQPEPLQELTQLLREDVSTVFTDSGRHKASHIIRNMCTKYTINLINRLKFLQPRDYGLVSSKKKIRDTKSGEMVGFKNRIKEDVCQEDEISLEDLIRPSELRDMDIEVPTIGEVLDIVYVVQPLQNKRDSKASLKMHLLKYAQKKQLDLNIEEYVNLFRTSAARISMCAFLPPNIDYVDSGIFKKHSAEASKLAKQFFSLERITDQNRQHINETPQEIQIASDITHIKSLILISHKKVMDALLLINKHIPSKFPTKLRVDQNEYKRRAIEIETTYPISFIIQIACIDGLSRRLDDQLSNSVLRQELCRLVQPRLEEEVLRTPVNVIFLYIISRFMASRCIKQANDEKALSKFLKWLRDGVASD